MRKCEKYFTDTCKLMRKYMEQNRPQSFASVWKLFLTQKMECEYYGIKTPDVSDIVFYAEREKIERFRFE